MTDSRLVFYNFTVKYYSPNYRLCLDHLGDLKGGLSSHHRPLCRLFSIFCHLNWSNRQLIERKMPIIIISIWSSKLYISIIWSLQLSFFWLNAEMKTCSRILYIQELVLIIWFKIFLMIFANAKFILPCSHYPIVQSLWSSEIGFPY